MGTFMRSYIRIYGPPILEAIKELEKLAVDMPEVRVMDQFIQKDLSPKLATEIGGSAVRNLNAPISRRKIKFPTIDTFFLELRYLGKKILSRYNLFCIN